MSIYTENGYKNRRDYLDTLAAENGVPEDQVYTLASVLGPDEDFDALVTAVEDLGLAMWDEEHAGEDRDFDFAAYTFVPGSNKGVKSPAYLPAWAGPYDV